MELPEKIKLANLPTKIEKLERLSEELNGPGIYIKRDDQTGSECSGNKIRKLEFAVREAMLQGADTLITCGGIQSNHARATAYVAAKLGIKSCLFLKEDKKNSIDGNYFLDLLFGSDIKFVSTEDYANNLSWIMDEYKGNLESEGRKGYIIPIGALNGIGTFGYYKAMEEILLQEKELSIKFDAIVSATGSGGTYAGLFYANKEMMNNSAKIFGVNVCNDTEYFRQRIIKILQESFKYTGKPISFTKEEINIIDGYVGKGYALSSAEELSFIHELAKLEGVLLDTVYTGKAMYGLVEEVKKGKFNDCKNILFIHTGGLFSLFPFRDEFKLRV